MWQKSCKQKRKNKRCIKRFMRAHASALTYITLKRLFFRVYLWEKSLSLQRCGSATLKYDWVYCIRKYTKNPLYAWLFLLESLHQTWCQKTQQFEFEIVQCAYAVHIHCSDDSYRSDWIDFFSGNPFEDITHPFVLTVTLIYFSLASLGVFTLIFLWLLFWNSHL